jgi:hypothetical protein
MFPLSFLSFLTPLISIPSHFIPAFIFSFLVSPIFLVNVLLYLKQQTPKLKIKLLTEKCGPICQAFMMLGNRIASTARDWVSRIVGTFYRKLGRSVNQVAKNQLIKETTPQVFLQAVLICCDKIFPQERTMKTLQIYSERCMSVDHGMC